MTISVSLFASWQFWLAWFVIVYSLSTYFGLTFKYINIVLGVLLLIVGVLLLMGR